MDGEGLRASVRGFLKDKRYVIVLDDLWSLEQWDSMKNLFPDDLCGGCIITTTRNIDVATTCCHDFRGNVHKMQPLTPEDSWTLFCKKTFADGNCPPYLEDISRSILRKCEGLPLGIAGISGLLSLKDTTNLGEWEMILRNLGGELESHGKLDRVRKILLLSYNDLPYYLQSCLLYMGIFSEDAIVETNVLTRLWIAQGFVEVRPGMTTMEVAQSYLNELVGRNLIQAAYTWLDGRLQSCRVHDLIYNIILSKRKEHGILTTTSTSHTILPNNVRCLALSESTILNEPVRLSYLRSIIRDRKLASSPCDSFLPKLVKGNKLLKVLHLEGLNTIPEKVFKSFNLTYLSLSHTNVMNIPKCIGKLQNLEHLILKETNVKELPAEITYLKKLSYLGVHGKFPVDYYEELDSDPYSGFKAPYELGGLISLQSLEFIEADSEKVIREIGKLTNLRELGFTKITKASGRELCSSLEKLTNLQQLYIQAISQNDTLDLQYSISSSALHVLRVVALVGRLVKVPDWVPLCRGLSTLNLVHSFLRDDPLESLEGLPNLVQLRLLRAYEGDTLHFRAGGFQKLKYIELMNLSGLKSMTMEEGTLPHLEALYILRCPLLEELPQDIQNLSKLQTLYLFDMPKRLVNNLRCLDKESSDFQKIAHINIVIGECISGKWEINHL